jgi:hypothetical protein
MAARARKGKINVWLTSRLFINSQEFQGRRAVLMRVKQNQL